MKKDQEILFAYPKAVNKRYMRRISVATGQPLGYIIDKMVESFRLKKEFVVEKKVTSREKSAMKVKTRTDFKVVDETTGTSR